MCFRAFITTLVLLVASPWLKLDVLAQQGYELPPPSVVQIIDADPEPSVSFSPDRNWSVLIDRPAMPGIEDVSRRMLRLAGMRIDPAANGPFRTSYNKGLVYRSMADSQIGRRVKLPANGKLSTLSWSHASDAFTYSVVTDGGTELWGVGELRSEGRPSLGKQPVKLTDRLSTVMGGSSWMPDGKMVLARLVPEGRGAEPVASLTPSGPNIQESYGNKSPTRTYQDLLANPHDEILFSYYATSQIALIDLSGKVTPLGEPAIYSRVRPSPDGKYLLVERIDKPFSYLMTYRSFPRTIEVWELGGQNRDQLKSRRVIADIPMAENIPIEGVRQGPRNLEWKAGDAATLIWTEALDGGDPRSEAEFRDRIVALSAPFKNEPSELVQLQHRASGVSFFADPSLLLTTEYDRERRWVKAQLHDLKTPGSTPQTMMDRSIRDRYGDPGRIVSVRDETGHSIALQDGDWVYRTGDGASPRGNLPFLDRQNLKTLETERLWRCTDGTYEQCVGMASSSSDRKPVIITRREDPTTPPNYLLRDLNDDTSSQLTDFQDPTPAIRGIKKKLVNYERADGVPLSATLYLPADYQEGTRLPLLVWAYPREFSDAKTAAQISGSPHRFTRMGGITHLTLLTQGYAIMDSATMPVIGDPETMNDTFVEQIVAAAQAAIDKAVDMGVADRDRVAVGGHSYGAFMTANLLAHCDLFQAGIARSGAYNRTLTPFGFQSERRAFWDAKDIYFGISPFLHANKNNEPILLIQGENDNNSGTFPMQSKRMYQAIKGNGGSVRLVMLPNESHGYRARESVLHTQSEMIDWLDKHVKNRAD
ncbi:MAG: prolyl oligopeptidase family serine peptidase [Planctomycetota bacterium]|nr:prolyl oligopeptidase family serine peptidase [Planctomycetota bacterium]